MWNALHGGLSLNHEITSSLGLRSTSISPKINPDLHRHNSVRVDPYAHPQHIKVLKHFVYIQYGCGMQSEAYVNHSHDITTSLRLRSTPISRKSTPNLHVKVPEYAVNMLALALKLMKQCLLYFIQPTG
jgi:hypothetical protein